MKQPLPSRHILAAVKSHLPRPRQSQPRRATFTTAARSCQQLTEPLNLPKWLSQNSHLLRPPINNYCVTNTPQTIMIVGGPNARTDFHINTTPEYFYQYKGSMLLKTVDVNAPSRGSGKPRFKDIPIHEGCMYLLPANTPHNPVRFAETVGVVIEQPRPEGEVDRLRWYCQGCGSQVEEASFVCTDLGTQIKDAVLAFEKDTERRTCKNCGTLCDVRPADVEALRPVAD